MAYNAVNYINEKYLSDQCSRLLTCEDRKVKRVRGSFTINYAGAVSENSPDISLPLVRGHPRYNL
ncbi:hypothetical protein SPSYN_00619 [Sporotomaculum syntrophicum]|uniref:Uncharacterized protein n=1 Tax=Sporotomaculum syntrophicum TaxID=182264 RepID=A0A9D3AZH1_9FIRM|nr:hypothetical protein [Sporotomaculum syntrophicum]KAF1085889.1 hypothetical protein SPSYN_00619 [Sporotomaculum syntrophicum]